VIDDRESLVDVVLRDVAPCDGDPRSRTYRARASRCELTNASARRMGLAQLLVRGVAKATSVALLTAITHDVLTHASTLLA
jgi:hypothetical protein